ncbi:MAG: PIN domain-containing protein [Candidatus Woesearchaeota archaeon]
MQPEMYYVDTCVWLNILKDEVRSGVDFGAIALDFLTRVQGKNCKLAVSPIVLKELQFKLDSSFEKVRIKLVRLASVELVAVRDVDYKLARKFESEHALLSFFDYLHVAIAFRLNFVLVTRDKNLLNFASQYVEAALPEDIT